MKSSFTHPDLMVVGDSLAQGCRSLTVSAEFCGEAYSTVVARLLGYSLAVPDMKREILFNLEEVARFPVVEGLFEAIGGLSGNYDLWRHGFLPGESNGAAQAPFFDNLAIAGSTLVELVGLGKGTPDGADYVIGQTPSLSIFTPKLADVVSDLHVALNSRFVLNPSNAPEHRTKSQIDWVLARQPRNLIFHAGHNDGLYRIGSEGDDSDWQANWGPTGNSLQTYFAALDRIVADAKSTTVLVLGLPKVGAVANLMPLGADRLAGNPAYFAQYVTTFPGRFTVSGDCLARADAAIASVNSAIMTKVSSLRQAGASIGFFDVYAFFESIDSKNLSTTARPVVIDGTAITNTYLKGQSVWVQGPGGRNPHYEIDFASGGLQSLDGMHPSAIGYALLALELTAVLGGQAVSAALRAQTLKDALANETLISDFPAGLELLVDVANRFNARTTKNSAEEKIGAVVTGVTQAMN